MNNPFVLARCNMFGVIRNVEYLLENDEESKKLISKNISIKFKVNNCLKANLSFKDGKATLIDGKKKSNMSLYFFSPEHFNKMVNGDAIPFPARGITKLGFLTGPFTKLTDRMEKILRADDELLKDPEIFKMNTEMTLYAAFFALAEIANYDKVGMMSAALIDDGIIQAKIGNELGVYLEVNNGILRAFKGFHEDPRVILSFKDHNVAHAILNNKLDFYTGIALGDVEMNGFIPMIEYMNPIFDLVGTYLA